MLYLWGPGLDAGADDRQAGARGHWLRRAWRALALAGRDRPRPW
jgi:hypothetical protein